MGTNELCVRVSMMVNFTNEEFDEVMVEWINEGKLKEYLDNKFNKWLVFYHGSSAEVFISDDEIDTYDEENKGYEDLFWIVDEAMNENGMELEGEEVSWVTDRISEGTLTVNSLSEMIPYSELKPEFGNDGKLLYIDGDSETIKEIIRSVK